MDLLIKVTNQVTIGNIAAVVILISAVIAGYYKIRRLIAKQHYDFIAYVKSLTDEQTSRIEACIHKIPSHPENSTPVDVVPVEDSTKVLEAL